MCGAADSHLGLGSSFVQQACVVKALVGLSETMEKFPCVSVTIRGISTKLVGDCQAQQAKGKLVFGLNRQDVAANRFCFFRFIQRAVELGF